jgi:hypothetical protein
MHFLPSPSLSSPFSPSLPPSFLSLFPLPLFPSLSQTASDSDTDPMNTSPPAAAAAAAAAPPPKAAARPNRPPPAPAARGGGAGRAGAAGAYWLDARDVVAGDVPIYGRHAEALLD